MKLEAILLLILFVVSSAGISYEGTFGVYSGCASGCCCPTKGSLIKITSPSSGTLELSIEEGSWTGCDAYGWTSSSKLSLPWDDSTFIDTVVGRTTTYNDKSGSPVTWTWYPIIASAEESADGIKKGDTVAALTSTQGSTKGCQFIIGSSYIKPLLTVLLLVLLFLGC